MTRGEGLSRLGEAFDIVVVGGGATGLGVAVDAAARGYRTLLVEARDFSCGTSSRSTKLIHGGVRYLRQGNVRLVREALHERETLLRNAPHLVSELRFVVPAYRRWEMAWYGAGLAAYDLLAGHTRMRGCRLASAASVLRMVPTLASPGLRGGVLYSDGQFDDARLALALARTAHAQGAALLTYCPVTALLKENGRVCGVVVRDEETGAKYSVRAGAVVNATGVASDALRRLDEPGAEPIISPSQGIHLVLDRSFLPGETAIMVPRTEDGRVVFLIPWHGRTLVGTTDTPVEGASFEAEPVARAEEIDFLLEHAGRYLSREPERADVRSVFAGLRPLVRAQARSTAQLARDHAVLVSASGLVTIAGGKWTTYRRMAEDTVDRAAAVGNLVPRPCPTSSLRLDGAGASNDGDDIPPEWRLLGATRAEVSEYEDRFPGSLHPDLPYSLAMAACAIETEMPVRVEDVLSRRLRALLLDARAAIEAAPAIAALMAKMQGKSAAWAEREVADFRQLARQYCVEGARPHDSVAPRDDNAAPLTAPVPPT